MNPPPPGDGGDGSASPARRWFHRESISFAEVAIQVFSVVLGILLALAIGEWNQHREERRRVETALRALRAEVEDNRAEVAKALEPIARVDATMKEMAAASPAEERPCTRTPGWSGFASPLLLDSAYQTAIATQTLAHMEFAQVQQLARLYGRQQQFRAYTDSVVQYLLQERPLPVDSCRQMLSVEERNHLDELDAALAEFLAPPRTDR